MAGKKELKYEIIQTYGVICEKSKGWRRELNKISWDEAAPKYDIRDWSPNHEKMGKGITLSEEELLKIIEIANNSIFSSNAVLPDDFDSWD